MRLLSTMAFVQPKRTSFRTTPLARERRLLIILIVAAVIAVIISASRARVSGSSESFISGERLDMNSSNTANIPRHYSRTSRV